jgi:hypothetical protein
MDSLYGFGDVLGEVYMKKDELTIKQRKWLKEYLETGNATEAAMRVYNCKDRDSASNVGWENVRKLEFAELMEEGGITDAKLQAKINEGLESNKVVSARVTGREADERTDDFIEVPDMPTRQKYLETALKVKGKLGSKVDITSGGDKVEGLVIVLDDNKAEPVAD